MSQQRELPINGRGVPNTEDSPSVPSELLFDILDMLPSRALVALRSVSHEFKATSDSLLRGRLLKAVKDSSQELVFDSHQPADYRKPPCHPMTFAGFEECGLNPSLARFAIPHRVPQFLPLDDEEQFGSVLLSIQLRGVDLSEEPEPVLGADEWSPTPSPPFTPSITPSITPSSTPGSSSPLSMRNSRFAATPVAGNTPSRQSQLTFSLSLAEGLERVFRPWFEEPAAAPPAAERLQRQVLEPSGSSALKAAHIDCVRVAPSPSPSTNFYDSPHFKTSTYATYGAGNYTPSAPRLFEFYYRRITVDVGKLVVGIEQGLEETCSGIMLMSR